MGFVVGWLLWTFVTAQKTINFRVLSGLITIAVGSAALAVFRVGQEHVTNDFMFYFMGVFVAVFVLALLRYKPAK